MAKLVKEKKNTLLRVPMELRDALKETAEALDDRTMVWVIKQSLIEFCDKRGLHKCVSKL